MKEGKESKYEASFAYSKGALDITPKSWHNFAFNNLREKTINYMNRVVGERERILIFGVGAGDILPYVGWGQEILKIGIDINKRSLKHSKKYCDVVLASASHVPIRDNSIDLVFFDLVLHHLKGQRILGVSLKEAYRVLINEGRLIAIEPSSLNPSGFLMNVINMFHFYSKLFGGSNYEYALSPKAIKIQLSNFSSVEIKPLTFLHPRLPLSMQRFILKNGKALEKRLAYFAWMFLITAYKLTRD